MRRSGGLWLRDVDVDRVFTLISSSDRVSMSSSTVT